MMKEIILTDGSRYIISHETFEAIKNGEQKGLVYITELDIMINLSHILKIVEPELTPYWGNNRLNQAQDKILKDGKWQFFDRQLVDNSSITFKDSQGNDCKQALEVS